MERSRERVRDAYAISGDSYDAERLDDPRGRLQSEHDQELVSQLLPPWRPGMRTLEAGAGTGRFTTLLLEHNYEVVATDINASLLAQLDEKVRLGGWEDRCKTAKEDLFNLTFESSTFDLVICIHVIPRLRNLDDQQAALMELARVVKPGGRMLFNYNNRHSPAGLLSRRHTTPTPFIRSELADQGFHIEEQRSRWLLTRTLQRRLPLAACRFLTEADLKLASLPPLGAWDIFVLAAKSVSPRR